MLLKRSKRGVALLAMASFVVVWWMLFLKRRPYDVSHAALKYTSHASIHYTFASENKGGGITIQTLGKHNTVMVYSHADTIQSKLDKFNMFILEKVTFLTTDQPICTTCVDPCWFAKKNGELSILSVMKSAARWVMYGKKFDIIRGFTNKKGKQYIRKEHRGHLNATNQSNLRIFQHKNELTIDTKLKVKSRNVAVYDYFSGGGDGITTFILSWKKDQYSLLNALNSTFLNSIFPVNKYYNCYSSSRVKAMGGWSNISGSVYLSTCILKCSNDVRDLLEAIIPPAHRLLTDYSETHYTKSCDHSTVGDIETSIANKQFVYDSLLLDVVTALDIVTVGGLVSSQGLVFTNKQQMLYNFDCSHKHHISHRTCPDYDNITFTEEVFVLTQQPTKFNYYHFFVEQLSRMSTFIPFLQQRPNVAIHVHTQATDKIPFWLNIYGLVNPVVSGAVRARTIYVPHGGGCHNLPLPLAQMSSKFYHLYISKVLLNDVSKSNKTVIIFIKRKHRPISNYVQVLDLLSHLADQKQYDFVIFDDTDLPSVERTMELFYRARLIVGPHGAGLSNVLFSRPGTTVVEVHCVGVANIRLAFLNLALKLGMRYYGTMTSRPRALSKRCSEEGMMIEIEEFKHILSFISTYL